MKAEVYGQDECIDAITDKIHVQAGLKEENNRWFFCVMVPTGVGKTETARQLASNLGVKLVRFDMSEYPEKYPLLNLLVPSVM